MLRSDKPARSWDEVPEKIKGNREDWDLKESLTNGAAAQYESGKWFTNMKGRVPKVRNSSTDTDSALKEYPELFSNICCFGPPDRHVGSPSPLLSGLFSSMFQRCQSGYSTNSSELTMKILVSLSWTFGSSSMRERRFIMLKGVLSDLLFYNSQMQQLSKFLP